jgi:hypothetical protein
LDDGPYPMIWIDALTQKVRENGRVMNVRALVAAEVNGARRGRCALPTCARHLASISGRADGHGRDVAVSTRRQILPSNEFWE